MKKAVEFVFERAGAIEVLSTTYAGVCTAVRTLYLDCEIGHDGDLSDGGDRTLVWASEADSVGDDGTRALGVVRRV